MLCSLKCSSALALTAVLVAVPAVGLAAEPLVEKPRVEVTAKKPIANQATMDVVETAVKAGSFRTLATALKAAGLVETLKGKGPFTILAPTDEAFAKLPSGTLELLLKPENKAKLSAILTYHVIPGTVTASDLAQLKSAKTVNGASLEVKSDGDTINVDGAKVTKSDIHCANGVIHIIDTVLIPKD